MKKKIGIIFIITFIVSLILLVIFDNFIINVYNSDYFSVSYNYQWKSLDKSGNGLKIKNSNGDTIEIFAQKYNLKDNESIDDLYFDLNNTFLRNNSSYKLINNSDTIVGYKYYSGYEFLYENGKEQLLYIVIVKDDKLFEINYLASSQYFDLDLDYFYDVINTLEIR